MDGSVLGILTGFATVYIFALLLVGVPKIVGVISFILPIFLYTFYRIMLEYGGDYRA